MIVGRRRRDLAAEEKTPRAYRSLVAPRRPAGRPEHGGPKRYFDFRRLTARTFESVRFFDTSVQTLFGTLNSNSSSIFKSDSYSRCRRGRDDLIVTDPKRSNFASIYDFTLFNLIRDHL